MSEGCAVVKKRSEGIPAWVMTFADLMSLLLAFFVLLFSFSEIDKNIYKEMAGSLKLAFGVQREVKAKEPPKGINIIAREFSPGRPVPTPHDEVRQMTTDEYKMHPVFTDASDKGQENQDKKTNDADIKSHNTTQENILGEKRLTGQETIVVVNQVSVEELELIKRIRKDGEDIRLALDEEINSGLIDMEIKEPKIILRIREKGSFSSGSAELIEPFRAITNKISEVFSGFDGMIIVSGHTDNVPIQTHRFRSNWELSASRAVSVIHELSKNNLLKKKRFQIEAYADTRAVDSNDTVMGRAKNRRVEIILDYSKPNIVQSSQKVLDGQVINNNVKTDKDRKLEKPTNHKIKQEVKSGL